jgi:transcriptional regulator with XRE-family HTH domain
MGIGTRLRELREQKGLGQGDVERLTGIKRCYTSRVEHGHTVPGSINLEKYTAGLVVPMYRPFGEKLRQACVLPTTTRAQQNRLSDFSGNDTVD